MKAIYTFLVFLLCFSFQLNAQKVVALHSPTNGVQYFGSNSAFQEAYTAAIPGDTIYLPGGTHTPPSAFDKQLTIFGAGHYPNATTATQPTTISGIININDSADGFYLEGVTITSNLRLQTDVSVDNVTIKRCKFGNLYVEGNSGNYAQNNNFIENIFNSLYSVSNLRSSSFYNNIIQSNIAAVEELSFYNNLFLYDGPYGESQVISQATNCIFTNNVFVQDNNNICEGSGQSTWTNNIFCTSTTSPLLGLDPILDENFFMDRSMVLVNQTTPGFNYDDDYHLQPGAAANTGADGIESGLYDGFFPFKDSSIPVNPHIVSKSISAQSNASGQIQVDITVQAQNN